MSASRNEKYALKHASRMSMRSVDHDGVHSGLYQTLTTLCRISPGTNRSRNTEPSLAILACIRKLGLFLNILDSDKPF